MRRAAVVQYHTSADSTGHNRALIEKVLDEIPKEAGLTGPHTYYALPGRMLISFLGSGEGGLPAGMAEFTNDGKFIRRIEHPAKAPRETSLEIAAQASATLTINLISPASPEASAAKKAVRDAWGEDGV